jgi:hypothetical protein
MRHRGLGWRLLVGSAVVVALCLGAFSVFTEAQARPCICPMIYAPVLCDNGRVYSNACVAACAHAKNCVPIGGPILL